MTETYIIPGTNIFKCAMCSRKGNNIFIPVTLKMFNRVILYGPQKVEGKCKACGRTSIVELARPAQPVPDAEKLSAIIKKLLGK